MRSDHTERIITQHSCRQPAAQTLSREIPFFQRGKTRKAARRSQAKRLDLSPFNLANPNDVFSAHQMLIGMGLWQDGHEGLFKFAMATVMARRLAKTNPAGYLARIVQRGLWGEGLHGPAERDEIAAKEILRELGE